MSSVRSPLKILGAGQDPRNDAPTGLLYAQLDGGVYNGATKQELNNSCDLSQRNVSVGAALTLTIVDHAEKFLILDNLAGSIITLPPAVNSGAIFTVYVAVTPTSNSHKVQCPDAANTIRGSMMVSTDGVGTTQGWRAPSTADTVTLNGTTSGGAMGYGEWMEFIDAGTDSWICNGVLASSGTNVSPFSAAVS